MVWSEQQDPGVRTGGLGAGCVTGDPGRVLYAQMPQGSTELTRQHFSERSWPIYISICEVLLKRD